MAQAFPDTPATLLAKIANRLTGQRDEMQWVRFFDLYQPAIRKFAEYQGAKDDADDVTQDILLKLMDILRNGRYSSDAGKFRCYLATLIRRTALSAKTKAVYRAYVIDEMPLKDVMAKFGVSEATVYQSKTRVGKMIAALEAELCE